MPAFFLPQISKNQQGTLSQGNSYLQCSDMNETVISWLEIILLFSLNFCNNIHPASKLRLVPKFGFALKLNVYLKLKLDLPKN